MVADSRGESGATEVVGCVRRVRVIEVKKGPKKTNMLLYYGRTQCSGWLNVVHPGCRSLLPEPREPSDPVTAKGAFACVRNLKMASRGFSTFFKIGSNDPPAHSYWINELPVNMMLLSEDCGSLYKKSLRPVEFDDKD